MTVTEASRRDRQTLLDIARHITGRGPIPTRSALQKTLGVGWDTAKAVHAQITSEREQARSARRADQRAAMARIQARGAMHGAVALLRRRPPRPASVPAPQPVIAPVTVSAPVAAKTVTAAEALAPTKAPQKPLRTWPVLILCLPAFVAIWGGWVDLGGMTGFGVVHPFPGIYGVEDFTINTAITLPFGMETYAAYALHVWLSGRVHGKALKFARRSAIGSLLLGFSGQSLYHLMAAAGWTVAPWPITLLVSGIPVAVLGMGAALAYLVKAES